MDFDGLYQKCKGDRTGAQFARDAGVSPRMLDYCRDGGRHPGVRVWWGMLRASPNHVGAINTWFMENFVCGGG